MIFLRDRILVMKSNWLDSKNSSKFQNKCLNVKKMRGFQKNQIWFIHAPFLGKSRHGGQKSGHSLSRHTEAAEKSDPELVFSVSPPITLSCILSKYRACYQGQSHSRRD